MTGTVDTEIPEPGLRVRLADNLARRIAVTSPLVPDRPLVSFTFDDVPVSAATQGAGILEDHGVRGTYYIAGSFLDVQTEHYRVVSGDDIVRLHERRHEIACHSFSHGRVDSVGASALVADLLCNRSALKAIEPTLPLQNFAYPYGFASLGWKRRLRNLFNSSRTVYPRVNTGQIDRHYLSALPLMQANIDAEGIERLLDAAQENNGWAIFYGHDVTVRYSPYGCPPAMLRHAVRAAQRRGIAVATIQQGIERLSASTVEAPLQAIGAT